jgi:hypothetical protein
MLMKPRLIPCPDGEDVAVLDRVGLAFEPPDAGLLATGKAA